ncbi:hypothetical protein AMS68_006336 [Peltaster fructicola]|uniref:Maltose/galactoside acetyltransferase domain-containing protein n=1 Tax=Peltaster fructicola TaxID=286661 RepID=A0A6H0Y1S7_9PEZI|nr:hypothetical protein AMS68_006336 [Peltaster fructicola]
MAVSENKARALRGELYFAFTPQLTKERRRSALACHTYNQTSLTTRRKQVQMLRDILGDTTELPPEKADEEEDAAQFDDDPWVEAPVRIDYGTNTKIGKNVFINFNCTILDTCEVTIGARTLIASNVSIYSATHPLDPAVRNGTQGPELGGEIHIGEDCWIAGNVVILPGITIGDGAVDVAPYTVVAGNPAKKIKDVPRGTDAARKSGAIDALQRDIMRQTD